MVEEQLIARGIADQRVLRAMVAVPRERFVPAALRAQAHNDSPLPIGHAQTISQPYIVAAMSERLGVAPGARVLEIGTGSGYQTAVLAELGAEVFSIELVPELSAGAAAVLAALGYQRVHLRVGDGYRGWPEAAPFDAILLAAAPPALPAPLIDQLATGGRLIAPVGRERQELRMLERTAAGVTSQVLFPVLFVPMLGRAQQPEDAQTPD